jgi:hypothetical protein
VSVLEACSKATRRVDGFRNYLSLATNLSGREINNFAGQSPPHVSLDLVPDDRFYRAQQSEKSWVQRQQLTTAFLSYVILLGGMCTIVAAVYTILVSYSSLPWWDTWEYIATIAKGESPLSPSWLWRQHNEHRMVIQKLFFVVDLKMFHARQVFLLASILVIQFLHLALLSWSMRVLGGWRGALWRSGVGLMAFCIFCPSPWLTYTMGFQVCFVLSPLFATLSFVGLLLYWTDAQRHPGKPSSKFLWLSILAALGGCGSSKLNAARVFDAGGASLEGSALHGVVFDRSGRPQKRAGEARLPGSGRESPSDPDSEGVRFGAGNC